MLFTFYCRDRANHEAVRQANRPEHLAYLDKAGSRIVFAGPLLTDDGARPLGSLLIVDCDDRRAAEAFAAGDPYATAGLFAEVVITAARQARPAP
jgi:uncharacterized protein YciI